ncbi:hypothetical protein K7X08_027645 [Anisodus acutangulus]|uniref:Uncharacterized protein n=1 Tax=Anisodus acutangulus TaxID=402998 RepID=A0A9Q1LMK3_9SOLA|nr:hypothetical protein K7X08_027645 [Anisodus acutangulus]
MAPTASANPQTSVFLPLQGFHGSSHQTLQLRTQKGEERAESSAADADVTAAEEAIGRRVLLTRRSHVSLSSVSDKGF